MSTDLQWADPDPKSVAGLPLPPKPPPIARRAATDSIQQASEHGSHLALLMALRHSISAAIDTGVAARDLAALSRRLIEIDREVRALSKEEADPVADGLNQDADDWPSA